jgi:hypothetical protein
VHGSPERNFHIELPFGGEGAGDSTVVVVAVVAVAVVVVLVAAVVVVSVVAVVVVAAVVVNGAGDGLSVGQSFQPGFVMLKSEVQEILPLGSTPSGPAVPL